MSQNYNNLITTVKALNDYNIKPVALAGTLLGLVRDSKLIEWDPDVDIGIVDGTWGEGCLASAVDRMISKGFKIKRVLGGCKQISLVRNGYTVDLIKILRDEQGGYYNGVWYKVGIWPFRFRRMKRQYHDSWRGIEKSSQIPGLWIPVNVLSHLNDHYGPDWMTPRRDWHWMKDPRNIR